ncbi:MAG TPA: hypothetical protein PLZ51_23520, partial [Aggregatilineales bacterium]|nr:hypothetical protein [Aggregatilineales bacterium]
TGQLPFNADDIGALLLQQVKQPAPPLRNIVPTIPVALENVILKSLEKNANRRYQSGAALAGALESALNPTMEEEQPVDMDTAHKRPAWADTLQTAAQKRDS